MTRRACCAIRNAVPWNATAGLPGTVCIRALELCLQGVARGTMLSRVSTGGGLPDSYQLAVPALTERGLVFGRNTDSDIVLNTDLLPLLISRTHAKLLVVGHALFLQDAGSTNGTYVNEGRLHANVSKELVNGNTISFGGPKLIIRDGQHHQNPFVYRISAVDSVTGQAQPRLDADTEATQAVEAIAEDVTAVTASSAPTASAVPASEQLVDLTRTSSAEAGPSGIVDLTGSPDIHVDSKRSLGMRHHAADAVSRQPSSHGMQQQKRHHRAVLSNALAGQKRTKSLDEPEVVAVVQPKASPSDGGAKQALENEFECTICRDFMVATHSVVPCGHMFCGECLSEWLQKNPSCPKCRAAANAPPVRTMAVDNVLESLVEKGMSKEDLQERKQRKQHWEARAATINARMKSLFRHGSHHAPQSGHMPTYHGHHAPHAAMNWEAFAAMHGLGMHPRHLQPARPLPPPPRPRTVYTVTANTSTSRVLCKGCRNSIALHCMQIGYSDRRQMRWYHLGCLSGDRWQEAAAPGRLHGLPHLHPSQQDNVQRHLTHQGR